MATNTRNRENENEKDLFEADMLCYKLVQATGDPVLLDKSCLCRVAFTFAFCLLWYVRAIDER